MSSDPVRVGIIGYGNWGPRIARVFSEMAGAEVGAVCDLNERARSAATRRLPGVPVYADVDVVLGDPSIQAVYIATPVSTHESLTLAALDAGKDVLVEKPMAASVVAARRMMNRAKAKGRILMIGHTFVFSPPVQKLRSLVASGDLGRILYMSSSRENLGIVQKDVSVIWDLAPHDLSILLYVTGRQPVSVAAHGKSFYGASTLADVSSLIVEMDDGSFAYVHVSWVSPVKLRKTTFVGDKRMALYDDMDPVEKIRIFDRRIEKLDVGPTFGEFQLAYRYGDVLSPVIDMHEPLAVEAQEFVTAVRTREEPRSGPRFGLQITSILEAAEQSLNEHGRLIALPEI